MSATPKSSQPKVLVPAEKVVLRRPLEKDKDGGIRFKGCSKIADYEVQAKLGEGTFGEVYKGRCQRTGRVVALKKILVINEKDGFPITSLREIKLLKSLNHVNVLKLVEMAVETHKQTRGEKKKKAIMYMVTPYMDHDLSGLLENPDVKFTVPQIKCYMIQLLKGVAYLHEEQILHRDLKAANILINNRGVLQIADFGLARLYSEPVPQKGKGNGSGGRDYTTMVVTRWYRPPELLLHLRKYTPAIDMWGVGCVFAEMFHGRPILSGHSDQNQIELIFELMGPPTEQSMPGWKALPGIQGLVVTTQQGNIEQRFGQHGADFVSLLSQLLRLDWRKRVNALDALEHPYFKKPPLPAWPGDIPRFEDSHELDRRRFRGKRAALPPAPAGGTVGMGQGPSDWASRAPGTNGTQDWGSSRRPGDHGNFAANTGTVGFEPHHDSRMNPAQYAQRSRGGHNRGNYSQQDSGRPGGGYQGHPSNRNAFWRQPGDNDPYLPKDNTWYMPNGKPLTNDQGWNRSNGRPTPTHQWGADGSGSRDQLTPRVGVLRVDSYIPDRDRGSARPPQEGRVDRYVPGGRDDDDRRRGRDDRNDRPRWNGDRDRRRSRSRSPVRDRDRPRDRDREHDRDRDRDRNRDRDRDSHRR